MAEQLILKGIYVDNRFVVPYNPILLKLFNAHINIEKCNQSTAIKYLFKYISKGHDRVVVNLVSRNSTEDTTPIIDEVQNYLNCRYVYACETSWRIFGFPIHHRQPSVERLSFHLPDQQHVVYADTDDVLDLVDKPRVCESQFLSWMNLNKIDKNTRKLTYSEIPNRFVYDRSKRLWKARKRGYSVGRMPHISPSAGELYYLRILLGHSRGPTSFDDIKTVNGNIYSTFREACFARGLLDDDTEFINALKEAATWAMGYLLRQLFVSMLLSNSLHRPNFVWDLTRLLFSEDMMYISVGESSRSGIYLLCT